jgi:hypothetical protein
MAITLADVSVAINGDIRWEQGAGAGDGPYTVLELHRFLQDLADDAQASGDDLVDITSVTPSERSTDNIITLNSPYNVDAQMVQHLYDGSITQSGGDEVFSGLVVVGTVNSATTLMIIQDRALYDDGVHNPDEPFWGTDLNADATANILMRCMIQTRYQGSDIDGKRVRVQAREYGDTYAEFSVTMGLGNSTAAIFTNEDLNNATAAGTVSGWSDITNETEGWNLIDLLEGSGSLEYYSEWNRANRSINDAYERAKWLTMRSGESTLYGLDGELFRGITHQVEVTNPGGTFNAYEPVQWLGGRGQMLAIDSTTAAQSLWIQLLSGVAPSGSLTITGESSSASVDTNTTVTARTLSPCFLGQSTGTAIIGAYGIGFEATDVTYTDKLFDLTNVQRTPPNNVTFTVYGLVSGEDYVLVTNDDSTNIDYNQFQLLTTLSGTGELLLQVSGEFDADTPTTGNGTNTSVRVELDSGIYRKIDYTSWTSGTGNMVIPSTNFASDNATAGNNVFLGYVDTPCNTHILSGESFVTQFDSTRTLFIRVRDGGGTPIKTSESTAALTSAGGSSTATRTSDA